MNTLVAIVVLLQLARMSCEYKIDKKMASGCKRNLQFVPRFVHEVLACLVDAVYASDNNRDPKIRCERLGYKAIEDWDLQDDAGFFRCRVFERDGPGSSRGALRLRVADKSGKEQSEYVPLRKYVVAVRGTIIPRSADIRDDYRVVFESACERKKFYEPIMKLLSELHRRVGTADVWVTGHSLGAAIILVAARRLAEEEGIVLATHLFNPPNLSADLVLKKLAVGTVKGLGSAAGLIPFVGWVLKPVIKQTTSLASYVMETSARKAGEVLAPETYEQAATRNRRLLNTGFRPDMYVNPKDFVCNEYIPHFRPRLLREGPPPASTSVLFRSLIPPDGALSARGSCHLIPRAVLHVNRWATGPWHAHKLTQWYLYHPVDFTSTHAGHIYPLQAP